MAPSVELFSASKLAERAQRADDSGTRRRGPPIDLLKDCKLQEMVQYTCDVESRNQPDAPIICRPLVRTFRRCAGDLTVETTMWKGEVYGQADLEKIKAGLYQELPRPTRPR